MLIHRKNVFGHNDIDDLSGKKPLPDKPSLLFIVRDDCGCANNAPTSSSRKEPNAAPIDFSMPRTEAVVMKGGGKIVADVLIRSQPKRYLDDC